MNSQVSFLVCIFILLGFICWGFENCSPPDEEYLEEGEICGGGSELECAPELSCCYPCGIEGCDFVCTPSCDDSDPGCIGGCYLYP